MPSALKIGCPPGMLDDQPHRFPVLWSEPGSAVVAKPAGILSRPDPEHPTKPSLESIIHEQAQAGKPELLRLGFEGCSSLFDLDQAVPGALFLIGSKEKISLWREHHGSRAIHFSALLICRSNPSLPEKIHCELPVVTPRKGQPATISHRKGKRSETVFHRRAVRGDFECREATTAFWRPQMVRLHARESGLELIGDPFLTRIPVPSLQDFRKARLSHRKSSPSFYHGPLMLLQRLSWSFPNAGGPPVVVTCPPQARLQVIFKTLFPDFSWNEGSLARSSTDSRDQSPARSFSNPS